MKERFESRNILLIPILLLQKHLPLISTHISINAARNGKLCKISQHIVRYLFQRHRIRDTKPAFDCRECHRSKIRQIQLFQFPSNPFPVQGCTKVFNEECHVQVHPHTRTTAADVFGNMGHQIQEMEFRFQLPSMRQMDHAGGPGIIPDVAEIFHKIRFIRYIETNDPAVEFVIFRSSYI